MSTLSPEQQQALDHIRASYMGPAYGPDEEVRDRPDLTYVCGVLFPLGRESHLSELTNHSDSDDAENSLDSEEIAERAIAIPEEWSPSSVAITFLTQSPSIHCNVSFGTYLAIEGNERGWRRTPRTFSAVELTSSAAEEDLVVSGQVYARLRSRWRRRGDSWLVTVSLENILESLGGGAEDVPVMLFQASLEVECDVGFLPYSHGSHRPFDPEEQELAFRFRNRVTYAAGHGMAATWNLDTSGACKSVLLDPVPWTVAPRIKTTSVSSPKAQSALELKTLCRVESDTEEVTFALDAFCDEFAEWTDELGLSAKKLGRDWAYPANSILQAALRSQDRLREGVSLLKNNELARHAFRLAMQAMLMQMGRFRAEEPVWRPFQLGFILASLASTADEQHQDRELVDLIWFPTGGGKTEAYLGLAAFEIFRRRLSAGDRGGGTAIITRYTLRLLTAQQFQRSAALICAMELMRKSEPTLAGTGRFTIGLWVGDATTPNKWKSAVEAVEAMRTIAEPRNKNVFQLEKCPWCQTDLVPREKSEETAYGFRVVGSRVEVSCTDSNCAFASGLPVAMVDEALYVDPPTILLSTVDKFARLQVVPEARALLGIGTPFDQPSLIIQDELHLLAGPLGTTVAAFEAAIITLLELEGVRPKIVASTATIRSAADQVKSLYGRPVALYPPAGFEDDQSFFSQPVLDEPGRLYIGLMPQSVSQASAVVASATPLLEIPELNHAMGSDLDAYWTLVVYHNSLRELGRSEALIRDDTNARLKTRAYRRETTPRNVEGEGLIELTSRKNSQDLTRALQKLEVEHTEKEPAADVVLSSNMLSVGIDVQRLALMLMVGQPKTTSEYIQATSRVGRGQTPGIVVTLFRANRARDRSFFEAFRGIHESLYRYVEPTSVTPWTLASRHRSLAGCLVLLLRNGISALTGNDDAQAFNRSVDGIDRRVRTVIESFIEKVQNSDETEEQETRHAIRLLLDDWERRAKVATEDGVALRYEAPDGKKSDGSYGLLKRFGIIGDRWAIGDSMRSVEPMVGAAYEERIQSDED